MGPCIPPFLVSPDTEEVGEACAGGALDLKGVIDWETPEARVNCSLNSTFVRPFARQGSFFTKNSSRAHQPPPTRTITVDLRILTSRNFWESPNLYFPSPTWKTLNFCLQVHCATCLLISSSILCVSVSGPLSSQSGLRATMNSLQSIIPSPWSNLSATAFISSLDEGNLALRMPSMNSSLGQ